MSPCLSHSHHISRLHLQTQGVIFRIIKGEKEILPSSNGRCDGADRSTACIIRSCFPGFRESSSSPKKIIIPAEKPQTWETLWLTKATWGGAEKKAAFNHRSRHAELLSKHPRYYQKTQSMPGGMFTPCTCDTVTAWYSLSSAANLRAHACRSLQILPWAARPGSWHGTQLGAHLKSCT